jgi:hypothetical protein
MLDGEEVAVKGAVTPGSYGENGPFRNAVLRAVFRKSRHWTSESIPVGSLAAIF